MFFSRAPLRLAAALATIAGARGARSRAGRTPVAILRDELADVVSARAAAATSAGAGAGAAPPARVIERSARFVGVLREGPGATMWEAVLELPAEVGAAASAADGNASAAAAAAAAPREISGGEYEDEAEAARAYDALARMYLGAGARTNFARDAFSAWVPPARREGDGAEAGGGGSAGGEGAGGGLEAAVAATGQIATRVGVPLTAEEVVRALEQERGVDVRVVSLAGRSDLAEALVFATGRSVPHMRRMADMVSRALRKRRLPGIADPGVEARDMDDWMLVDCGNLIVSVMDAEARECFALEKYWEGMRLGEDPHAGLGFDEWLRRNPVPDKWNARLERDEVELRQRGRVAAAPPQGASAGAGGGPGAGAGAPQSRAARLAALGGAPGGPRSRGPTQLARRRAEKKPTR